MIGFAHLSTTIEIPFSLMIFYFTIEPRTNNENFLFSIEQKTLCFFFDHIHIVRG